MQIVESIKGRLQSLDNRLSRHAWYRVTRNSILVLNQRNGSRIAAATTYFAVFSIFPFILLLISLLSFLLDSTAAQDRVISALSDFLPAGSTGVSSVIQGVINARGIAVGFGVVLLLWGALGWFQSIDQGVNDMWATGRTRSFIKGKLFALAMIIALGGLMFLSWAANIAVGIITSFAGSTIGVPSGVLDLAIGLVTIVLMFLVFLLLYRYSPLCDLTWRGVWRAALVTAFLWSVLRSGFAVYVTYFANYASAYGPIGAVIAFLVWLYLAHMVICYGAALGYATRLDAHGIREPRNLPCAAPGLEEPNKRRQDQHSAAS